MSKKPHSLKNGFTLLELLVVLALISTLASVALLQYPFALTKVRDSRVITSMTQFRIQGTVLFSNSGDYAEIASCAVIPAGNCACPQDQSLDILCRDIQQNTVNDLIIRANSDQSGYCAVAYLAEAENYLCIDNQLRSKRYAFSPAANGSPCDENCSAANSCACE